ncbi:PAS domain S-box-containing protein [Neorhizobium huautlense]|uniref:Blue-light-activated histidine kinase n=1 Tax=Neorhizobium huautlense TaxID=67774 RepID=A0ABT9Q1U0_9HYPH|nr:PAS domain S-box protein [Neorhizobium huautlense]MDP9840652.1 PAS domain S-box-containing protein [Neorhizobium huautlense]
MARIFQGTDEISRLIESGKWDDSMLGPPSAWPPCLKSAVDIMLPAMAQIVIFWGPDLIALYNEPYAPTIGLRHPQAFARPARENWAELWDDLEPLLRRVMDTGETVSAKDRPFYIERHGYPETVYFDISYSAIRDEDSVRGVFCIVNETTDRVRADQALQESEERLRAVVSQSAAGIGQGSLEGEILHVNSRFCEIVGYDEKELLGMNIADITYDEDMPEQRRLFNRLAQTGESFDMEKRYVRRDGGLVWVNNTVSALRDEQGQIRQVAVVSVDISERKRGQEAERRLASIIASSNDAILGIDLAMTVTSWNGGAERLYGYNAEEIVGQSVLMLVPEDRLDEEPALLEQIKAGSLVEAYETKRRRKDLQLVDILLSVSPIHDTTGRIIGASKIAHDISAKKEADRLQEVLIGELHHRVKNVFATVIAIARQTLAKATDVQTAVAAFEARLSALAHAHDLLADGDWQVANLAAVVEQAVAPYPPERFDLCGPSVLLPQKAVATLSLALHELGTNAAKYGALSSPSGRVAITWKHDPEAGSFSLRWTETGGPPVTPPTSRGFGSRLIERLLAAELNGSSTISYDHSGVQCEIEAIFPSHANA